MSPPGPTPVTAPRPGDAPPTGPGPTGLTVVGVRHHSPACARLVQRTIERLRPAHVLVEGPADMNGRIGELLLDHELPVAVFSSLRTDERVLRSWSPLAAHSPELVALRSGSAAGASVRFMDLPAWHPAFGERENRYSDAERRYAQVQERLCRDVGVDNPDVLWDALVEVPDDRDLDVRLAAYFELLRADLDPGDPLGAPLATTRGDTAREAYMASWLRAALADAGGRPVVAVCGGFHRPALLRLAGPPSYGTAELAPDAWPEVPQVPEGAVGGSFVVPFSFARLDAFRGYASGMPSPGYYQDLWEVGPVEAAERVTRRVVSRLRARRQPVSTADLIAAAALTAGLARLRGHAAPARTDVLDGLVSALVSDALEAPLPWTGRGRLQVGTHPVVVEMVAALSGDQVGRLHADTPAPPLVHDVAAELERHAVPEQGRLTVLLSDEAGQARSRVLHRLTVLALPGWELRGVSADGLQEQWQCSPDEHRHAVLAEAGAYGRTLAEAAGARLAEQADAAGGSPGVLAGLLEQAVRCGLEAATRMVVDALAAAVGTVRVLDGMGELLSTATRVLRRSPGPGLLPLLAAAVRRTLWLLEGETGAQAPADPARELAVVGVRDACRHLDVPAADVPAADVPAAHAPAADGPEADVPAANGPAADGPTAGPADSGPADAAVRGVGRTAVLDLAGRLAGDRDRPADLRGACVGLLWALDPDGGSGAAAARAARAATTPARRGAGLAGLFAVAREQVLLDDGDDGVLAAVDSTLVRLTGDDFLAALPALRQAFAWFPPREREQVAALLLRRRGLRGSAGALLRAGGDPLLLARAAAVEQRVTELLDREHLLTGAGP